MNKFKISVIIPSYNEEKYIGLCLQSLVSQKTKRKFEVILVNNNSTDNTKNIALSFRDKLNLRIITEKQQGRGVARWRGFEEATGDFLFSSDADTIFPNVWIERLMSNFKNKKVVAVTSLCNIDDPSKTNKAIFKFVHQFTNEAHRIVFGYYCLYGFSYAIRRDIYIKAGKIDKTLNALDDIELGRRVKNFGKIHLVKDIAVLTSNRRYKNGLIRGLLSFVKPDIQVLLLKKNKFVMDNPR